MTWFLAVLVVLAMGAIALVAAGRGEPMVEEYDDRPDALVPADGDLGAGDLRRVRFSLAFRGYRMSEVDALLTRLADQLDAPRAEQATAGPTEPVGLTGPATRLTEREEPGEPAEATERRDDWTSPG